MMLIREKQRPTWSSKLVGDKWGTLPSHADIKSMFDYALIENTRMKADAIDLGKLRLRGGNGEGAPLY